MDEDIACFLHCELRCVIECRSFQTLFASHSIFMIVALPASTVRNTRNKMSRGCNKLQSPMASCLSTIPTSMSKYIVHANSLLEGMFLQDNIFAWWNTHGSSMAQLSWDHLSISRLVGCCCFFFYSLLFFFFPPSIAWGTQHLHNQCILFYDPSVLRTMHGC